MHKSSCSAASVALASIHSHGNQGSQSLLDAVAQRLAIEVAYLWATTAGLIAAEAPFLPLVVAGTRTGTESHRVASTMAANIDTKATTVETIIAGNMKLDFHPPC